MSSPAIGITGDITIAGYNIGVKSGSLNLALASIDVTTTADGGNKIVLGGVRGARGSAVGVPKTGTAGVNPGFANWASTSAATAATAACVFKVNGSTCQYTFNALLTSIRISFTYSGAMVMVFDFESSGAVTETWG